VGGAGEAGHVARGKALLEFREALGGIFKIDDGDFAEELVVVAGLSSRRFSMALGSMMGSEGMGGSV